MSDDPASDDPQIPEAVVKSRRRWPVSLVWLVPLVAVLFGGWFAVQALREHGPTIAITFKTAESIQPHKTKIKYKNVDIGEVKDVLLSRDRSHVIVIAQLTRQAKDWLVEDTRFWVVRPRISAGNVTGIGTLLSGSHIGMDAGKSSNRRREFVGLEQPAIGTSDQPGRQFVLRGEDLGSLDIGSPVEFRHIQVGQVVAYELDQDGKGVTLKIFVNAPYDRQVNMNSRFWHADGFEVTLDASGLKVNTQSMVSILLGGLAFQTPPDMAAGPPAEANAKFNIFADRAQAMKPPETVFETYVMVFKESVRGLALGAPVDFRGVVIGEVITIDVDFNPVKKEITVPVKIRLHTAQLYARRGKSVAAAVNTADSKKFLEQLVQRGLRAQLRTANLLTGQLYIALDFFPDEAKANMDWTKDPAEFPTVPGSLQELQVTLASIAKKLEKVPFEAIGADLHQTLQNANKLIQQLDDETVPEMRAALTDARRTLTAIERTIASDSPLQQDAHEALREIARAAQAFRVLSDYLERHPEALIRGKQEDGK